MPAIIFFAITSLLPYLFSLSPFTPFLPQLIAAIAILTLLFNRRSFSVYFISLIINLIVFTTGGLNSPVFFLIYFLLLVVAFQSPPQISLAYSLVLVIILSQTLNSSVSLLPLFSLIFISPLAWFIGQDRLQITADETNFFLWLSLKFKTSVSKIIDSASIILSHPLSHSDREQLHSIRSSAKNLLNSANRLLENSPPNDNDEI